MANRFTDTEKWRKQWVRSLNPKHKLFWVYILDECNHAGIWEPELDIASLRLGVTLDDKEILSVFGDKVQVLKNGKWFIPNFVDFQYKTGLNPENRAHKSVIELLKKEGVSYAIGGKKKNSPEKEALTPEEPKDKKDKYIDHVMLTKKEYEDLVVKYGVSQIQTYIAKVDAYVGSTGRRYKSHYKTIIAWLMKDGIRPAKVSPDVKPEKVEEWIPPTPEEMALIKKSIQKVKRL